MSEDFVRFLIQKDEHIKHALKQLDETAEKVLYVIGENRGLIGSLSDGDIRRGLLKGIGLNEKVELVMNENPKYIERFELNKAKKIKQIMLDFQIQSLPILNDDKTIADIAYWVDIFKGNRKTEYLKKKNKVFILAGGVGSRLEPFTRILPKPLVPVGEQPILEKIMDKFSFYGYDEFFLSVNYKAEMIKLYFNDTEVKNKYSDIQYIKEDMPLGTIGSLYLIKDKIQDSFFITNSDILIEEDMDKILKFHKDNKSILTIVGCIKNSVVPYGVLNTNDRGYLLNIDEKPQYKHIINTGVYVAEPEIIEYIKPNVKEDITELMEKLLVLQKSISIYPILEEQWFDIGQWAEYERTRKYFEK